MTVILGLITKYIMPILLGLAGLKLLHMSHKLRAVTEREKGLSVQVDDLQSIISTGKMRHDVETDNSKLSSDAKRDRLRKQASDPDS